MTQHTGEGNPIPTSSSSVTISMADLVAAFALLRERDAPPQTASQVIDNDETSLIDTPGIWGEDSAAGSTEAPKKRRVIHVECTSCGGKGYHSQTAAISPDEKLESTGRPVSPVSDEPGFTLPISTKSMPRPSTLPGPAKGGVSADALQLALAAVAPPCDQAVKSSKWYCVTVGSRVGVFDKWPIAASYTSGVPGGLVVVHYTRRSAELAFESARAQGAVKVVLSDGQAVIV